MHLPSRLFLLNNFRCLFLLFALLAHSASAQWIAINDQGAGPKASNNVTFYTPLSWGGTNFGLLKNIANGTNLPVYLRLTSSGTVGGSVPMGVPNAGTPAYVLFNGYVDWTNQVSSTPGVSFDTTGFVGFTFSGLNPQRQYSFAGTAVRASTTTPGRNTKVELVGADSSTDGHSAGVITPRQAADLSGTQVALNTGSNTNGDVVRWNNIIPSSNGTFSVNCSTYGSSSAYALGQIRLEEQATNMAYWIQVATPTNGQVYQGCAPLSATVTVFGRLTNLAVYLDGTVLTNVSAMPWPRVVLPYYAGLHSIWAIGYDVGGNCLTSPTNVFEVVPPANSAMTRGPFLQNASSNSVQIIWRTCPPGSSFVEYGLTPDLGMIISNAYPMGTHVITLQNLEPGTAYYYRVGSETASGLVLSSNATFRTLTSEGSVAFSVVGDTANYSGRPDAPQPMLANVLGNHHSDLIVHLGDVVSGGFNDTSATTQFFNIFQPSIQTTPWFLCIGNHDLENTPNGFNDNDATNFLNTFYPPTNSGDRRYFSFDHGDVHFVCLYSPWFQNYVFSTQTVQYAWLTNDLATSTKPWKLIFVHTPVASSGPHAYDDMNQNQVKDMYEVADALFPAAAQYGVQMIFTSHDHDFERFAPTNGVHALIVGGGGKSMYYDYYPHFLSAQFWSLYHCVKVAITNDTMTLQAFGTDGVIFDSMTVQKALPPAQLYQAQWHTPAIQNAGPATNDANIMGQTFDFAGPPIYARAGQFSNLGRTYVNNDANNLYIGLDQVMIYRNQNIFLFVESPRQSGVSTMAGIGNGVIDPDIQGADGLDCLENLAFTGFAPSIGCILGDEYADGQYRSFARTNLGLNIGQGVYYLNAGLSDVPGVVLQQFNRSPQTAPLGRNDGATNEQNADFIEMAIPYSALGWVQPGDTIKLGAVVGKAEFDPVAQTRSLDTSVLGYSLTGSGQDSVVLEGLSVRLAVPPLMVVITPVSATQYQLSWNAEIGKKYTVEYAAALPNFVPVDDPALPLTAASTTQRFLVNPPINGAGFYRVRIVP